MTKPKAKKAAESESSDKKYVLSKDSHYGHVRIDGIALNRTEPVTLTQDQYERASSLDGVDLVSADQESGEE